MEQVAVISQSPPSKKTWIGPAALLICGAMAICLIGAIVFFAISALRSLQLANTHHWLVWVALFSCLSVYLGFKRKFVR